MAPAGTLPVMGIAYFLMLRSWNRAVDDLADYQVGAVIPCWQSEFQDRLVPGVTRAWYKLPSEADTL